MISSQISLAFKKCKKERIIEDYLEKRFYEKPSVKRRREKLKKLKQLKILQMKVTLIQVAWHKEEEQDIAKAK